MDLQVVCRMGHIGLVRDVEPPDPDLVAFIKGCDLCGARADWRRKRKWIVTTNRGRDKETP